MNPFQWPRRLLEGSCCLLIPPPAYTRTLWILSASQHSFYSCSYQYGHKAAAFLFAPLSFFLTFFCTFIAFLYWNRAAQVVLVVKKTLPANAAAAAKSLQSCPTLCDSIDGSPPGSPVPGILQARTLEWVAISFSNAWKSKVKGKSLNRFRPSGTPWTAAHPAPPSMGFSRQEYWSGVPLPSPVLSYDHLLLPWIPHPPTTTIITL